MIFILFEIRIKKNNNFRMSNKLKYSTKKYLNFKKVRNLNVASYYKCVFIIIGFEPRLFRVK